MLAQNMRKIGPRFMPAFGHLDRSEPKTFPERQLLTFCVSARGGNIALSSRLICAEVFRLL
jgi:hypothetical protein